jgi:hypothetical protein
MSVVGWIIIGVIAVWVPVGVSAKARLVYVPPMAYP